ncbi:MAG: diguanylate cyclase [Rhodospirillaceae bacterium]|nr:diguanylate cyclase [Rhodospirillaceae bacterium]MBT4463560.1 diguanylate cyclase [Rhodospirillaceae bacterium]MBT5309444.1 diguanylate cyclase [Rhodospirillaceae bacterium]MBT6407169.1 diguanylate cyclase [Rhodospirillaceae bacterium]MBT7355144.1 diguanylate cyclase [Rhodospirillaceae bacterium]
MKQYIKVFAGSFLKSRMLFCRIMLKRQRIAPGLALLCTSMSLLVVMLAQPAYAQSITQIDLTDSERRYLEAKGQINVCVDPDRMPFDGVNDQGEHDGLSGDYFKVVARMLDMEMVVHPAKNWDDLMNAARNRDCDVVSQINESEERKTFLDFSVPYFNLPLAVVTRYDRIFVEDSLEGAGNSFAVIAGDIAIEKLLALYPDIDLVEVENNVEGLLKVIEGKVFGYIGAQGAVVFSLQTNKLDELAVTGSLPLTYDLGVATRSDEPLLGTVFGKALQAIDPKVSQSIRDKWIAITIKQVTDYTLLWQAIFLATLLLSLSLYWNRRLARANQKISSTLSELNLAQTKLEEQNQILKKISTTDPLTNVFNRLKLDEALENEIQRAARNGSEFGVILLDIDHFKKVNDTYGHQVGDHSLVIFARLLETAIRSVDIVGRWGGEEFLILCPGTDENGCKLLAENLRALIEEKDFPKTGQQTASFGVTSHKLGEKVEVLIERADRALYRAKESGRNRVEVG